MERLTMTSDKGGVAFTFDLDITCKPSEAQKILKLAEKLKAYEDAEEQGLLLRLPYPFGTKLYYVIDDWDYGMSVQEVIFDLEFVSDVLRYPNEYFLTREEAEQALQKMKEGADSV